MSGKYIYTNNSNISFILFFVCLLCRFCSILFDEVCLNGGLQFNSTTDVIDGFIDSGDNKSQLLADHALVFMVRGIKKKIKQPVSYTFCQGSYQTIWSCAAIERSNDTILNFKWYSLYNIHYNCFQKVIYQVQATGLCLFATICDQGCANEGAINILKN